MKVLDIFDWIIIYDEFDCEGIININLVGEFFILVLVVYRWVVS